MLQNVYRNDFLFILFSKLLFMYFSCFPFSSEPEVETSVPVSGDDVEVVKEIPVEDNTSLPAENEQQASQHPTTTVPVETDAPQG